MFLFRTTLQCNGSRRVDYNFMGKDENMFLKKKIILYGLNNFFLTDFKGHFLK